MTTEPPAGDDVDGRSADAEALGLDPATAGRSFPRPLLVAGAVLAVVALAAGVFALTRGGDGTQNLATDGGGGAVPGVDGFWNSTWELVALERDGEPWAVEPAGETNSQLTTTDPGAEAIGYQACNQGTGTATVEGGRLVMTEFMMTAMGCMSEDGSMTFMDQEVFVTELLGDRPTIEITGPAEDDGADDGFDNHGIGDRLILTTAKGSAAFERTAISSPVDGGTDGNDPEALWDRMWDVTSLTSDGKTMFVALPLDGSPLRLDASTIGHLRFNGCNGAGGEFDLNDGRLGVKEIGPTTAIGCEQVLMDQDDWLQAFLEAEPTVTIDGDHLTLTNDEAAIELEAADVAVGRPVEPIEPEDPEDTESSPPQDPAAPVDPGLPPPRPPEGSVGPDEPATSVPVGPSAEPDETGG